MFTIGTSSARSTVSALTVLAAIGASGMVAEGAITELDPTAGARGKNSSYMTTPGNWINWLTESAVTYHNAGPGFTTWAIDFGAGTINSAKYRIDANGSSVAYGIPAGATLDFALVTEPWSAATPDPNRFGPDYGTITGGASPTLVHVTAIAGDQDVDITPILQTWQANPTSYYGVRFFVSAGVTSLRGGVVAPGGSVTGNLILDQAATPEPASLGVLGLGGVLLMRRQRK